MTKEEIYNAWAPADSLWSPWVKPVLFAHLDFTSPIASTMPVRPSVDWAPGADGTTAILLDLPEDQAVWRGLALVAKGYRPVPLYNALPWPVDPRTTSNAASAAMVNVEPILIALAQGAAILAKGSPPHQAPPVFLLDAKRRGPNGPMPTDCFDNRSVVLSTDFPSAQFLKLQGIGRVLLVQSTGSQPSPDLAPILYDWQEQGLLIELKRFDSTIPHSLLKMGRPSAFRRLANLLFRFDLWQRDRLPAGG